jgi:hypothetical protein
MRIIRSIMQDGTLAPAAVNYLGEIPEEYLYLSNHARRHPLGTYNVSLELLERDFGRLLRVHSEELKFLRDNISVDGTLLRDNFNTGYNDLLEAQKNLIHSLRAHIDDCYAVLASLVAPANLPNKAASIIFTDKWLKTVKFPSLDVFNDAISFYKNEYLAPLVNGLKHRQSRLRGLFFYKYSDVRLGYYLEDADVDGIPGLSPNVHKDRNSAYSFTRDIVFSLYGVYLISEVLVEAVKAALLHHHAYGLTPRKTDLRSDAWLGILRQASDLVESSFPDEIERPFACLTLIDKEIDSALSLRYPALMYPPRFPQGMHVMGTIHLDGVGKTYKIPYLQPTKYGGVKV